MQRVRSFMQIDVFSTGPLTGNPVAVVLDADGLTHSQMAAFARWTNLSETTFVLPPTTPGADYRLRIFTPGGELPFAGHPTLGSAYAWLKGGGVPATPGRVIQECGLGLVPLRISDDGAPAFAAPPPVRSGDVDDDTLDHAVAALGLGRHDVVDAQWVDNGPGWLGLVLRDAAAVLNVRLEPAVAGDLRIGVIGEFPEAQRPWEGCLYEVRAFVPSLGVPEDPVTGSLNAGLARWLGDLRLAGEAYVAAQGTALGRSGRVHVRRDGDGIWVGGDVHDCVRGVVRL